MRAAVISFCALLVLSAALAAPAKRGLSGLESCGDASALGLEGSWHYNWGLWPTSIDAGGNKAPSGAMICDPPMAAEFVPMFWGCWTNCTSGLWPGYREDWAKVGVKAILGFNEPDNAGQSNLTPEQASIYWDQLDDLAQSFDPPLTVVGPGMTHWDDTGGSPWLDQFLGNLSDVRKANIKYLAQHDYSGSATGIIAKAEAAYKKYGRKIWLTEFSVGSDKGRDVNDKFMQQVLPLLDASEAVERYAWYSARNAPASWVNESALLPPYDGSGWDKQSGHACAQNQMKWLSQHGNVDECEAMGIDDDGCAEPKTVIYQSGDVKNCYCANTSTCNTTAVSWQDIYVHHGASPVWAQTAKSACKGNEMLWLSQKQTLDECEANAESNGACTSSNKTTKTVIYQTGDVKNCYCLNTSSCTKTPSTWLDIHVQPPARPFSMTPTSTGHLYTPAADEGARAR